MGSIFNKIVSGEIPCYKVAETADFLAFLDVNPNAKGHTLCILKGNQQNLWYRRRTVPWAHGFSKKVAIALEKPVQKSRMAVIGLEVPHAHVHLIPLNEMDEMRFKTRWS
jgi:histidine triad (HIT) family protein